jgi:nitric oxide reductase NorD protein
MSDNRLTIEQIEEALDEQLDGVLSSRRKALGLAQALASFERGGQDFVLRWIGVIAKTNAELAYQFAHRAPQALATLDMNGVEDWLVHAMDVYDSNGLYPAVTALEELPDYAAELAARVRGVVFDDVAGVLQLFVQGLSGRELKLKSTSDEAYTDTTTLYLPQRLAVFAEQRDNFRLYKAIAAHLWAQIWYGTYRVAGGDATTAIQPLLPLAREFDEPQKALRVFHALETIRLNARLRTELAGLHRDMIELQQSLGEVAYPESWSGALRRLQRAEASVEDSYMLLPQLYHAELPTLLCYQGALFPERVERAMHERLARERRAFTNAFARLLEGFNRDHAVAPANLLENLRIECSTDPPQAQSPKFELHVGGQTIVPPPEMQTLMASILQDLGEIPPEYLVAGGDSGYVRERPMRDPADVWRGVYHEEGASFYNEWDYRRQHYRKNWCALRELEVHPATEPFVERTLEKYRGLVAHLRKTFEALRGEDKLLRRRNNGDDIDLDATIEAYADMRHGMEMSERVFVRRQKLDRNIAVMFMIDMSGSTKGWVNEAERESLVLLCEALEILGDRYAIYGFSGMTRKRCELFRVKGFAEPYANTVKARISGIRPQDYTRMGVIIRHLSRLLNEVDARAKLLLTLSDGKPDDYDGYGGDYGIEDTRQALIEAKQLGIHPFCITIDTEARDYLPHMYGPVNYTLVDRINKLPLKVADIYRRLTF